MKVFVNNPPKISDLRRRRPTESGWRKLTKNWYLLLVDTIRWIMHWMPLTILLYSFRQMFLPSYQLAMMLSNNPKNTHRAIHFDHVLTNYIADHTGIFKWMWKKKLANKWNMMTFYNHVTKVMYVFLIMIEIHIDMCIWIFNYILVDDTFLQSLNNHFKYTNFHCGIIRTIIRRVYANLIPNELYVWLGLYITECLS